MEKILLSVCALLSATVAAAPGALGIAQQHAVSQELLQNYVGAHCTWEPTKCHWKCIRFNCGFQAYPCTTNPTCTVGDLIDAMVAGAACKDKPLLQEAANCHLHSVTVKGYKCAVKAGDPNNAECPIGKERCPIEQKYPPTHNLAPEHPNTKVEQADSIECNNAPNSDPQYKCPWNGGA